MMFRTSALALGGLVALSGIAFAQEEAPKLSSSRQREVDRWKRDLGLSDSQVSQITKLFADAEAGMRKVLTADQKETLEKGSGGGDRGRGGFGGFGGRGGAGGMMGGMVDRLLDGMKENVGLTAEQEPKVKALLEEGGQAMQDAMAKARETGDWGSMRDIMRKSMEDTAAKVREILTPEQQAKYDTYRADMESRFGGRNRGDRGERGGRDRGPRGGSVDDRLRAILADLHLSEDEKLILEPVIKAVLEAQEAARKGNETAREALRDLMRAGGAAAETIAAKVQAVRDAEKSGKISVGEAQNTLRELVTMEQEAVLLAHGVLG